MIRITVYGEPAPQGSKRGFVNRKTGGVILVENNKDRLDSWREAVKYAALQVRAGAAALDGPIVARMVFSVRRPKGHYRSGKNAALLKTDAPSRPCSKPDLSKLLRSTEDALTDAGVWIDDARVVEYERAAKVFIGEDAESLDAPGVRIVARKIGERGDER